MPFFPAIVRVRSPDDKHDYSLSLYLRLGGQPSLIVPALARALGLGRRGLTVREMMPRICGAIGLKALRHSSLHLIAPDEKPATYWYDIDLGKTITIDVAEFSDANVETILYQGLLDNYLTKELRKPAKRRGRPPAGFSSRDEFDRFREKPTRSVDLEQEILNERAQAESPHLNLKGVRVFSPEEIAARRKAEKKALRERHVKK